MKRQCGTVDRSSNISETDRSQHLYAKHCTDQQVSFLYTEQTRKHALPHGPNGLNQYFEVPGIPETCRISRAAQFAHAGALFCLGCKLGLIFGPWFYGLQQVVPSAATILTRQTLASPTQVQCSISGTCGEDFLRQCYDIMIYFEVILLTRVPNNQLLITSAGPYHSIIIGAT